MQSVGALSLILVIVGAIMVYGSRNILKKFKIEINDNRFLMLKLIGLLIALIGIFRILK